MEQLKHECGIALVRLLKPIEYYVEKYGTWQHGLNKLYLLMEKQHNRGQEGAGAGCVSATAQPGTEYIFRERAMGSGAISEVFENIHHAIAQVSPDNAANLPFCGEAYMGHLRYSTTGRSGMAYVHPFLRRNQKRMRSLMLCGNFNMTNVNEIFDYLVKRGEHPRLYSDTFMLLEMLGGMLDESEKPDLSHILRETSRVWDGGYVICGITGTTEMFAMRDPCGIRPAFYYYDDEIAVVASERPVIQTVMNVDIDEVKELLPGEAFFVKADGEIRTEQIREPQNVKPCSFERIYFSRGSDRDIYQERKILGELLIPNVLKSIDNDLENTVFSFIPNTAEVAFYGMMEGLDKYSHKQKLPFRIRREKVAIKDIKLRTFITEGSTREDLAAHVYDITYGSIRPYDDNLVVIDDSIVRGTTLKQSIIKILDRLHPRKIVIVSSAPQIRYPDCYGIDMNRMDDFVAFRATIALLKERGMSHIIEDTYQKCKAQENLPKEQIVNHVKDIYNPFTADEISRKIAQILTPEGTQAEIEIVFQSIKDLHRACPNHTGDWYFSGNYPTAGGNRVVNEAFIKYIEKNKVHPTNA
ncbi:amidophosphoribosyltransferase [Paludibacter sp. 221]|uniref:amidophosphoribosyltransferase n=1 Tax=Paludibacter sp. 221 TaxID=2302939 RepID=UPI0013D44EEA|nr:amidophosphoribosyltransferase [Paludibacter sp. 221]NDV45883.1 amidophosphoribosyltransferase [Paludibacter sp. 221]